MAEIKLPPGSDESSLSGYWYNFKEACKILDAAPSTLRRYMTDYGLRYAKVGRKLWFNAIHIQNFLKGFTN